MMKKIFGFIRNYPLPIFVLLGIFSGLIARFIFRHPRIATDIWYATLIFGGIPIVWETVRGMLKGKFASDIVAMLAILTAIYMHQAFAGAVVVLMQSGGEALEAYGLRRASSSLDALLARAPRSARRKKGDSLEEIDVKEIKVGDVLIVRPGDLVPVDGTIVQGEVEIDESAITGEPLAKTKGQGETVMSGSVTINGAFEMRADKISEESQYAKMVELVRKAQEEKAPIQRLADRYAIFFTPLTLIMAFLAFLITREETAILAVLVVATPCPLILATPVAVISGINRAAQEGIIVKGGAPIEQVGRAKAVVFDKTGTITFGLPFVENIIAVNGHKEEDLLYKAALVEQLSTHSVASSIVKKASEKFKSLPLPADFKEVPGRGVEAVFQNEQIHVGSQAYLEESLGKDFLRENEEFLDRIHGHGKLIAFIAINKQFAGVIEFSDKIRPGVSVMVHDLSRLGVKEIIMLTGDSAKNAYIIAKEAGIHHVHANLLPEQKVSAVRELNKKYPVTVMVGDGINDAPALATAKVGIAMGAHGTGISAEAADIVLLVDDVAKVADAVSIGQRMLHIAKQSIFIGMGLSFLLMVIASFGYIQPAVGAMLQEIIDATVILNALRAR